MGAAIKATFGSLCALAAVLYARLGEDGFCHSYVLAVWLIVDLHDAIFDKCTYVANNGRIALVMGEPPMTYLRDSPELSHFTTKCWRVDVAGEDQINTVSCCTDNKRAKRLTPAPQPWPTSAYTTLCDARLWAGKALQDRSQPVLRLRPREGCVASARWPRTIDIFLMLVAEV